MTKNLTLAIDTELLERFRLYAAERKTSVNALLRKHIEQTVGLEERRRNAIAKMLDLGRETTARFDMSKWDRAETYSRGAKD